jgi:DNA-binding GntR family transcriptional regulator
MILQGDLAPGSVIPMDEIAKSFGVSRVPVRDALRILEGEALVTSQAHKGYRVSRLDMSDLAEINGIRHILETDAINRAAERLTDDHVSEMAELFERMVALEQSGDLATWVDVHRQFHFVLFNVTESSVELRALHTLWNASDLYRAEYLHSESARKKSSAQHRQLLEAVRSGEVGQMVEVMDAHRGSTEAALTETIPAAPE